MDLSKGVGSVNLSLSGSPQVSNSITEKCGICIQELPPTLGKNVCVTACGHCFHLKCVLEWHSHQMRLKSVLSCPICRFELYTMSEYATKDKELLRYVTRRDWTGMRELVKEGAKFVATIEDGDYDTRRNAGM
jgi:hypothetical protein